MTGDIRAAAEKDQRRPYHASGSSYAGNGVAGAAAVLMNDLLATVGATSGCDDVRGFGIAATASVERDEHGRGHDQNFSNADAVKPHRALLQSSIINSGVPSSPYTLR